MNSDFSGTTAAVCPMELSVKTASTEQIEIIVEKLIQQMVFKFWSSLANIAIVLAKPGFLAGFDIKVIGMFCYTTFYSHNAKKVGIRPVYTVISCHSIMQ